MTIHPAPKKPKRVKLPWHEYQALCETVLARDGWKCRICKARSGLHVHHIVFRSQQGQDTSDNLVSICTRCHDQIHAHVLEALPLIDGGPIDANKGIRWRRNE